MTTSSHFTQFPIHLSLSPVNRPPCHSPNLHLGINMSNETTKDSIISLLLLSSLFMKQIIYHNGRGILSSEACNRVEYSPGRS